jgi:DNA-binding response OmpR family regulator
VTPDELVERLDGVIRSGDGRWLSRCPAHEDKRPSLIVICSAEGNVESLADEIGADGWLQKPVDLDDLLAAVGRYVRSFVRHAQSTRRRLQ